jgi:hypothetical protein
MGGKTAAVPEHWPLTFPLSDLWISETPACCPDANDTRTLLIPDVTRETTMSAIAEIVSTTYKCGDVHLEFITYNGTVAEYEPLDPASTAQQCDLFNRVFKDRLVVTMTGMSELGRVHRLKRSGPSRSAPAHGASCHLPVMHAFQNGTLQCPLLKDIKGPVKAKLNRHHKKANQKPCEVR